MRLPTHVVPTREEGFTLTEALIGILIIGIVFTAMAALFVGGIRSVQDSKSRTLATSIGQRHMETIRNLPYDSIGVAGGWPDGILEATQTVTESDATFTMTTTVQYIDDPFDGLVTDPVSPDVFPWDYKRVQVELQSVDVQSVNPIILTSHFAPDGIESEDNRGTLLVHVIDANGTAVSGATVHVTNGDPVVDASQLSDVNGDVFFYALQPDNEGYHIEVTKEGYSSAQTYTVDLNPASATYNPNPDPADASIVVGEVTEITFAIDLTSTLTLSTVAGTFSSEWIVNTDEGSEDQIDPVMTLVTGDEVLFGWNDFRNNKWNTYSQEWDVSDQTPGWEVDLQADGQANQAAPTIAVDSEQNVFLGWTDDRNGNLDVYLKKFYSLGTDLWNGPKKVLTNANAADQQNPWVTADKDTGCAVVWNDDRDDEGDIYLQRCNAVGDYTLVQEARIDQAPTGSAQTNPQVVRDHTAEQPVEGGEEGETEPIDEFYVAWQDARNGDDDIYLHRVDTVGSGLWGNNQRAHVDAAATGSTQTDAQLLVLGSGDPVVAWHDDRNDAGDIYLQRFEKETGAPVYGADVLIGHAPAGTTQSQPAIAALSDDRIVVTWIDDRNGDPDVYATMINGDGTEHWDHDKLVSRDASGADQANPDVVVLDDGLGTVVFSWADQRNGDWDIYAATLDDNGTLVAVPNVPVIVRGSKTIGSYPNGAPPPDNLPIYKYEELHQTDANGQLTITGLEWDTYDVEAQAPFTLNQSTPALPASLLPNSSLDVQLNVQ
ncbi:MAG: prepilin-type N-terminal cleavage/methylation domain-containing protein [Candidatus Andersenbacteria bacterium]|nr:prepilin-type N-terminal cleavage/methylation domain-containing protein [Candidatus Andersenbacteria bacterium]